MASERVRAEIPARAGVGLKAEHYRAILADGAPQVGWFEIHAENYMGAGGPPHHFLERIRARFPVSLHGVGLSIGGAAPLDRAHLARLRAIADRYDPGLFSEHLAWSSHGGVYYNDLLPLPYNAATLARVVEHIDQVQEAMGRRMLLENPSAYLVFETATMSELEFLREVTRRTGCGLLLDVNNVFISAVNIGLSAEAYIDAFPLDRVGEIHLAGHAEDADADGAPLLIDAHDREVAGPVWELYARVLAQTGALPTLIEWDSDLPDWPTLAAEAARADAVLARVPA
ncbi:MAG: DUF692 family multinuclear iron-containing protein [Paracoccaceae bacterium]